MTDDDPQAGRTVWFRSSDGQLKPEGDNRYRVNASAKFYVVQLVGHFVNLSEYGERVIHRANRQSYVTFEGKRHQLRRSGLLKDTLKQFVEAGIPVYIGGLTVDSKNLHKVEPWPFIYIAPKAAWAIFKAEYLDKRSSG
jgi:hypothetical protein